MIQRTQRTLGLVQLGLKDLIESNDLQRQVAGLTHVMVFGQAVTIVLQHIRTFDRTGFDTWWGPRAAEMAADDLCKYFWKERSVVLKDGYPPISHTNRLYPEMPFAPMSFDDFGSTGKLPGATAASSEYFKSGTVQTAILGKPSISYIPVPTTRSETIILLGNVPYRHLGQEIKDVSAQGLCSLYVTYLANLVRDAIAHFSPSSSSSA